MIGWAMSLTSARSGEGDVGTVDARGPTRVILDLEHA